MGVVESLASYLANFDQLRLIILSETRYFSE